MALLFMDGFDHIDSYASLKWDSSGGTYASTYGRTGGWGFCAYSLTSTLKYLPSLPQTVIVGFAHKQGQFVSPSFFRLLNGSGTQFQLGSNSDGSLWVYVSSTLGTTLPGVISLGSWAYIELKITISATAGAIELRVNGETLLTLTGVDTHVNGDEYYTGVGLFGINTNASNIFIDDFYICDDSGTENNDFLGDVTITPLYPIADGVNSELTPSTGTDHFAVVDDPQLAGVTDYLSAQSKGLKETFDFTDFTGTNAVKAIQVTAAAQQNVTGTVSVRPLVFSGTTPAEDEGDDKWQSQTLKAARTIWEKEPTDDVAWTAAKINAAEFGIKIPV